MKWVLADHDAGTVSSLAQQAGLHPLLARLLVVRGITDAALARSFLSSDLSSLSDPLSFSGMDRAVSRVHAAVNARERIIVYGDYDVDGVSGSAVLFLVLRELGADVASYIPDRMTEGYGLNVQALVRLRESGARLVITVDCGISAVREAAYARELGLDLIITDHHESAAVHVDGDHDARSALPAAYAVLHPALVGKDLSALQRDSIRGLTGVGVAFKFAQALLGATPDDPRVTRYLDLVTLGTVADMGNILGENRILVKHGLALLSRPQEALRPGLAALKQVAGIAGRPVNVGTVGFSLAPRINASGRLDRADASFRLLSTDSAEEAQRLASVLEAANRERQSVEAGIWDDARTLCSRADLAQTGAFVLSSQEWHPGVIGIVASRIVDAYYRPAALIAVKDGVGKGSARSIPGFDLYKGLAQCSDLLLGFGGHKYAAGLTVAEEQIPRLRKRLSTVVMDQMKSDGFVRTLTIDAPVSFDDLSFERMHDIERLAPYGQGNPEPRFGTKGLEVVSLRPVGSNRHVKLRLRQGDTLSFDAIAYGKADALMDRLRTGSRVAAVFSPKFNTWNGTTNIELEIRDIKIEPKAKSEN